MNDTQTALRSNDGNDPKASKFPLEVVAAVVRKVKEPFALETVHLSEPRSDEVLVRLVATGMCHTDIAGRDGELPIGFPAVFGHEGAGIVETVGSAVTYVKAGDHVVLTYHSCGQCEPCEDGEPASCVNFGALCFSGARSDGSHAICSPDGTELNDRFFGQSSFAPYAIVHERSLVKVRKDAPLELLGPLGCGIMTGAGAVWNALNVIPGSSVAVFGAGAVGLSAAMAARASGAATIVCVDRVASRLELALELGATHVVNAATEDVTAAVRAATGDGVDAALDTTGRADVISMALHALRQRGKLAVVATSDAAGEHKIELIDMIMGCKSLIGVVEGGGSARSIIPRLIDLHMDGRFPFDKLTKFYDLAQINEAAADSLSGQVIKPILKF
ncbi:MAG: alcohol dehydrogenase [Sphingomonadales bacterium]|nr:alcohol dehydrogenase [Sphingomonadales bacterium]